MEGKPAEPVAWTRSHGGAAVFYTSLGHPDEFGTPAFDQFLMNAVKWALAQPVKPVAANDAEPAGFKRIGVAEFEKLWLAKKYTVLDVRTADEFKAGHIPGAINLDVLESDFEKKSPRSTKRRPTSSTAPPAAAAPTPRTT